jgi:hypothetical protein
LFSSCNCFSSSSIPIPLVNTSSCARRTRGRNTPRSPRELQRRRYAVVSDGQSYHKHDLRWPEVTSANALPTPYQIFNQRKGSPYSKRRFYELVKLYHPDRHGHDLSNSNLPYDVKVERYRLVVAANDILSDPVRRGAYDRYGAGWNGQPGVSAPRSAGDTPGRWDSAPGWRGGPEGPSQNATWEDWERWYHRDAGGPQEPQYISNTTFMALLVIITVIGITWEAKIFGKYSMGFIEKRDHVHNEMSKELRRRRQDTVTAFSNREDRIQNFLKQRDPYGYSITARQQDDPPKLLPAPEMCSDGKSLSSQTHQQDHSGER